MFWVVCWTTSRWSHWHISRCWPLINQYHSHCWSADQLITPGLVALFIISGLIALLLSGWRWFKLDLWLRKHSGNFNEFHAVIIVFVSLKKRSEFCLTSALLSWLYVVHLTIKVSHKTIKSFELCVYNNFELVFIFYLRMMC